MGQTCQVRIDQLLVQTPMADLTGQPQPSENKHEISVNELFEMRLSLWGVENGVCYLLGNGIGIPRYMYQWGV